MQTCLKDIMSERFPAFDAWAMSAQRDKFVMSMIKGSDHSAIMEALEGHLVVLGQAEDPQDIATGALIMFLFGLYLGQTNQGWLDGLEGGD